MVDHIQQLEFSPPALRRRRTELGMSQEALASRIGRRRLAVIQWEHGRNTPPASVMPLLSHALGVEQDALYEDTT